MGETKIIAVKCEKCKETMINFESGWELEVPNTYSEVYGHSYKNSCKNRVKIFYIKESAGGKSA